MIHLNQNTNPILSQDFIKKIHQIELKKPTAIYTSSHIDKLLSEFQELLYKYCGIMSYKEVKSDKNPLLLKRQYCLFITSGNMESNKGIIYTSITAFKKITKNKPHIILCETDNGSLIQYLDQLKTNNEIDIDMVSINVNGNSVSKIIEKIIKPGKTCLIIVGYINSVFGSINDIHKIGEMAHKYKIPIHVNCNYVFGHIKLNPFENNIDSFVIDFKNIGGIKQFGIIGIKKDLFDGYKLDKFSPEFKLTNIDVNPIMLEMANNTIKLIHNNIKSKNAKIRQSYNYLIRVLKKKYDLITLMDYLKGHTNRTVKKKIIILHLQNPVAKIHTNVISIILPDLIEANKKKILDYVEFDPINKYVLYHYKTIFKKIFGRINLDTDILDHILSISFSENISTNTLNNFIKILSQNY